MVETVALQHQSSYLQVAGSVFVIMKRLTLPPPQWSMQPNGLLFVSWMTITWMLIMMTLVMEFVMKISIIKYATMTEEIVVLESRV